VLQGDGDGMGRVGHACINREFHKTRLRLGSTDRPCQCGAIIANEDVEATGVWRDVDASVRAKIGSVNGQCCCPFADPPGATHEALGVGVGPAQAHKSCSYRTFNAESEQQRNGDAMRRRKARKRCARRNGRGKARERWRREGVRRVAWGGQMVMP